MKQTILQKLLELEQSENIKILYACESGSRAWGFASPDSDFDVRFIYSRPANDYLSIIEMPDVVGLPVNEVLDIGGWDLKKTLKLFMKSNAPLYEWLQSPIVYRQDDAFADELRSLMPGYFSLRSAGNHYLSMAHNTLRDDLQGEEVKLKRYFYALRPALACRWIVEKQTVPPMEFEKLRVLLTDNKIQAAINGLLAKKQMADEKAMIKSVDLLNEWLADTLNSCKAQLQQFTSEQQPAQPLNEVFRRYIQ
ncbi:nucleotidyltransferase domain-containing protein [Mucilaginibacter ginsenosidivorax]|uniref:Nucleotidyltransferase domain-containing protein n=1 Tax=Mucilaginibacter ginsenosidivorax TaxID=862126 RepID=A0A5B8W1E8_9SPHI|nr:nucleotidyltransferase domain-containing protein [Mucilaginibacter ginsenosidivorax]QEC77674.1 nucleotidyltransferase domain-containing protein [Mucilaginibacter ginsenosidivorax]